MKYLLDTSVVIAAIVKSDPHHAKASTWLAAGEIVLCPIVQLGFLRISTHPKAAIGLDMGQARSALTSFATHFKAEFIPDDLTALDSHPKMSSEVTDHYLSDLAARHKLKLATLDSRLKHPAAELIT